MLIVRSLRQDRVAFCVTSFVINNLGSKFVEPPVLDLRAVVDDSTSKTPLIFVLSPGVVGFDFSTERRSTVCYKKMLISSACSLFFNEKKTII
jgi:hypothetical protein